MPLELGRQFACNHALDPQRQLIRRGLVNDIGELAGSWSAIVRDQELQDAAPFSKLRFGPALGYALIAALLKTLLKTLLEPLLQASLSCLEFEQVFKISELVFEHHINFLQTAFWWKFLHIKCDAQLAPDPIRDCPRQIRVVLAARPDSNCCKLGYELELPLIGLFNFQQGTNQRRRIVSIHQVVF